MNDPTLLSPEFSEFCFVHIANEQRNLMRCIDQDYQLSKEAKIVFVDAILCLYYACYSIIDINQKQDKKKSKNNFDFQYLFKSKISESTKKVQKELLSILSDTRLHPKSSDVIIKELRKCKKMNEANKKSFFESRNQLFNELMSIAVGITFNERRLLTNNGFEITELQEA